MKKRRAAIVIVMVTIALACWLLAPAREQMDWWWAESHNRAADYKDYLEQWPFGRHAFRADQLYHARTWEDIKAAMILQAYREASHTNLEADALYRRQQRLRRDDFFWKQASTVNTQEAYRDYLKHYPRGKHSLEARRQLDSLGREAFSNVHAPVAAQ